MSHSMYDSSGNLTGSSTPSGCEPREQKFDSGQEEEPRVEERRDLPPESGLDPVGGA